MKDKLSKYNKLTDELIKKIKNYKDVDQDNATKVANEIEVIKIQIQRLNDEMSFDQQLYERCTNRLNNQFGINYDIYNRNIYINCDIEDNSAIEFLRIVNAIIQYSGDVDPINIYISSFGGDAYACLGIIDIINNSKCKFNTYCFGFAASAAFIIWVSGTGFRYISKNSYLMYHNISGGRGGQINDIKTEAATMESIQTKIDKLISDAVLDEYKQQYNYEFWSKLGITDFYIDSDLALKMGLATHIM